MLEDHARIAALIQQSGRNSGRKKLQKSIYIFQKLGFPFHQIFHFHFNGPYSEELSVQLEELCDFGFLIEDRVENQNKDETCSYRISEAGQDFLSHYKNVLPNMHSLVQRVINQETWFLESAATLLYFDYLPREKAVEKVKALEKRMMNEDFERALAFIDEIRSLQLVECPVSR
jgi:uncharacterized protein YwgA